MSAWVRTSARFALLGLAISLGALADTGSGSDAQSRSVESAVLTVRTGEVQARTQYPALTDQEWTRYGELMQGPRGVWSPNLDPIMVLGVHARTEEERRRYAELAVHQEKARVDGEMAFEQAYQEAVRRLYPDVFAGLPGTSASVSDQLGLSAPRLERFNTPLSPDASRLMVFLSTDCDGCTGPAMAGRLRAAAQRFRGVDVYLLGDLSDEAIMTWADAQKLPVEL
ncbi:MAG: TIGR03759 family integrating conjugative element protein, partial [Gammaproteobacteria bacterium]|nr:TIGR03759 family integrating conjugative element protein [Gammaproteobacteria bacterium]